MSVTEQHLLVEESRHELFSKLKGEDMPFGTMRDVFLAAICIGYRIKNRVPLEGKTRDIVVWGSLRENDRTLLRTLGLVETGDKDVLSDNEKLVTIAEEYANGGINELYNQLVEQAGSPVMNLIDLMPKAE